MNQSFPKQLNPALFGNPAVAKNVEGLPPLAIVPSVVIADLLAFVLDSKENEYKFMDCMNRFLGKLGGYEFTFWLPGNRWLIQQIFNGYRLNCCWN